MAILGGLFSRKDKSKSKGTSSATSTAFTELDIESFNDESEQDHTHLHPNTIYQNEAASSSKMKLPFGRSKSKVDLPATETPSPTDLAHSSLHFSTQSEPPTSPLTPPQKSVFGSYGDSGSALSTKSLPNVAHTRSESHETVKTTAPASAGKKSGRGLFSWVRDRKKSKAPPPPLPSELKEESFNLRAFRHVGGLETLPAIPNLDDTTPLDLPPARPRPRGDSVASETSQRVSVAAFREMQARRSQAGSPSPQPSSRPSTQIDMGIRSGSPSLRPSPSPIPPSSNNQSRGRNVAPRMPHRSSTLHASKSESDSDSDHGPSPLSVQWRSKSELGHSTFSETRSSNGPPVVAPQMRQGRSTSDAPRPEKRPPMPVSVHAPARPAAIQTRSSSRPSTQNVPASAKNTLKRNSKDSDTSDSSDDDAPLATLVQPRRPGSAMSNSSGRSLPPKPLIDIKSLSNSPLSSTPTIPSVSSSPAVRSSPPTGSRNDIRPPTNINERLSNLTQGLARPKPTSPVVPEPPAKSNGGNVSPVVTERTTPSRSTTAPPEAIAPVEKKSPPSLTPDSPCPKLPHSPPESLTSSPSANTMEFPSFKSPRASLSLDDPTPIIPTPVHHRVPQSGFSVVSRPQHHYASSASMSTISSAWGQAEIEPVDSIGDITAAMFSQLDLGGFSVDEGRRSLDGTIKKSVTTTMTTTTTKSTTASSIPPVSNSPVPGPTIRAVKPVGNAGKKEPAVPAGAVPSTALPRPQVTTESTTPGRSVGRPRSSTLASPITPQTPQPLEAPPQSRPTSRLQQPRPAKSTPDVSDSRKATTPPQIQPPSTISRRERVSSAISTSSESSYESSSSAPSIAHRKQKQPQQKQHPQQRQPQQKLPQQKQSQQKQPPQKQPPQRQPPQKQPPSQPQPRPQQQVPKPRSATMGTLLTAIPPSPTNSSNNSGSPALHRPPERPFAMRDNSPSSSTGDSSSGRLPITPRDGSELGSELGRGIRGKRQPPRPTESFDVGNDGLLSASNSEMGLKARKLSHRKSASYDDSTLKAAMKGVNGIANVSDEERRRERRRSEARNAIELGKVMNGDIKLDEGDDPLMGMDPRMSMMNPMMGMGVNMGMRMGLPQQTMPMMMGNPWISQPNPLMQQYVPPPPQNNDAQLLAAHQHAMMAAKQAYQLAVAQQAMQVAGEEWERGSSLGWPSSASSVMFPSGPRSMYAGSVYGGSEYGGGGWATSSVYGGGFGPSPPNRNSAMIRAYQLNGPSSSRDSRIDTSQNSPDLRQSRPRVKTGPDPSDRPIATLMQQQQKGRGRTPPPPSSWKRGAKP